jgi:hypothetical protein
MKSLFTAFAALVLSAVAATGIASAQTVPAGTQSTTVAQAVQPTPAAKAVPAKKPIVVFHLTPTATYNVGSADLPRPTNVCSGGNCGPSGNYQFAEPVAHLGYGAQIFLTKRLNLNYTHGYVDQNLGTVTSAAGKTTYQVLNDDRTDDAALNYTMGQFTLSGGWHERVRMCCGNNAPESAALQTAYHYDYLQLGTRVGPNSKYFGRLFGLTVQDAYIPHVDGFYKANPACVGALCSTPPYEFAAEGNKTKITYTGNVTVPVGGRNSSFALFGTYLNNWDYFDNSPIMYIYNQVDFGFTKKFSPWVSFTANDSNLYQHQQGYPFVLPNTINRNKLIVTLDIGLPVY